MMPVFDSHFHVIDPRFALVANNGFLPQAFGVEDYLKRVAELGVTGGAVVSGSFQAFDQNYLIAALKKLGPSFVGVTQLPSTVTDEEIVRLNEAGVRAIRFNVRRGGSESVQHLLDFGRRVHDLARWRVELYVDSKDLDSLTPVLLQLPAVSIDHLGLSEGGLPHLMRLVEKGVKVKATGFGRVDFDVGGWSVLQRTAKINPNALMFGTDLPSTRARRPFSDSDMDLVKAAFADDAVLLDKIFYRNARQFYGFETE